MMRQTLVPCLAAVTLMTFVPFCAAATPPNYKSFGREQRISHHPDPDSVLRIWVVYVGQGDGIVIQLPKAYDYDAWEGDDEEVSERVDILVDGGSFRRSNANRLRDFVHALYAHDDKIIEHAVVTHHDMDHVAGLTQVLAEDPGIGIETVYHNGLASYRGGERGFPRTGDASGFVHKKKGQRIDRAMARFEDGVPPDDGERPALASRDLIGNLAGLRRARDNGELHGVYDRLADAILDKASPFPVESFPRSFAGEGFISEREQDLMRVSGEGAPHFALLWPLQELRRYTYKGRGQRAWSYTINGNSLTFLLEYGGFRMLFTGDHNDDSEKALLAHLKESGDTALLDYDVLKVPHHGSSHGIPSFFRRQTDSGSAPRPVVSVASQGEHGARSYKHPSPEVTSWLGGAHRVYHTQVHEKRFQWKDIETQADYRRLYERSHVLVETDGTWFRVVEVPLDWGDLDHPPTVESTARGNGTRWIVAD